MINIRPALPEELPQLKDLWRKCFGDPSAYVDIFFQKFCSTDQVLVVDDDGEVDSMAAMLPGTIQLPDGTDVPVGYVYALATNPYMQGKGHARQLLKVADDFLRQRGDKAMVLGGMSKEGIKVIIKTLGRKFAARSFLKAVPVVGQAASALLGYQLVRQAGLTYIDACYELARERLLDELDARRDKPVKK